MRATQTHSGHPSRVPLLQCSGAMKKALKEQFNDVIYDEKGAIGYILAWLMGVPAVVLVAIWLLRGRH